MSKLPTNIPDEVVERAAYALEKLSKQTTYEWTDEQFETWWNHDPSFVEKVQRWPDFTGTGKERCLWEARITIEAAFKEMFH